MYRSILQILIFQPGIRLDFCNPQSSKPGLTQAAAEGYDAAGKALTASRYARGRRVHEVA
jgi:hypothetical protein